MFKGQRRVVTGVRYEPADEIRRSSSELADDLCTVGHAAFSDLVVNYPTDLTQDTIDAAFLPPETGVDAKPAAHQGLLDAIEGTVTNRLGDRRSRTYVARQERSGSFETVGWLTTAVDYTDRRKALGSSYLWLVNGAVHPNWQGAGVMSNLMQEAMWDPGRPEILFSRKRRVSAYPMVAPLQNNGDPSETLLPAERVMRRVGIVPSDPPEQDVELMGMPDLTMRRYQGPDPDYLFRTLQSTRS